MHKTTRGRSRTASRGSLIVSRLKIESTRKLGRLECRREEIQNAFRLRRLRGEQKPTQDENEACMRGPPTFSKLCLSIEEPPWRHFGHPALESAPVAAAGHSDIHTALSPESSWPEASTSSGDAVQFGFLLSKNPNCTASPEEVEASGHELRAARPACVPEWTGTVIGPVCTVG